MKRDAPFAWMFQDYSPKPGLTEQEALAKLERRAWAIVRGARWVSLSSAKVNELRQPLLELYLARRALRRSKQLPQNCSHTKEKS